MPEGQGKPAALRHLVLVFLKLGTIGFGGPAAHIALMEEEVVARRRWLTREHFLDLLGATNLIPGPNSTEMAIHVGYLRGGWAGLVTAGLSFLFPAVLITAGFAWAYVAFGSLPQVAPLLYGVKPVVLAVILTAVWRLGKTAVRGWRLTLIGSATLLASLWGANEILALLGGGILGGVWLRMAEQRSSRNASSFMAAMLPGSLLGWSFGSGQTVVTLATTMASASFSLGKLGLFFLKVGAVLYGSGYVLVAFLEGGLVHEHGWLTQQQLLDAIAVGQFTPGPVLSSATFVGYLLAGWPGAIVATLGIFLPSFLFVAALGPILPRWRRSGLAAAFLDAVNVSSVALMAAVTVKLTQSALTHWPAWVLALAAATASLVWKVNPAWLVLGGALLGWVLRAWA